MPEELLLIGPREVRIASYNDPPLRPGEIRAAAILSGISHGTELNLFRGTSPFHTKQFDPDLRLFVPAAEGIMYPARIGYEWVGRVTEIGADVSGFALGDLIHLPFGHRATHTACPAVGQRVRALLQLRASSSRHRWTDPYSVPCFILASTR